MGGLLARSIGGISQLGDKGAVLQGLGGFLAGQGSNATTNKSAATNAAPANQLIDTIGSLISKPKKDSSATNKPNANLSATNAPKASAAATNKPANSAISDLLKLIPEK